MKIKYFNCHGDKVAANWIKLGKHFIFIFGNK